MADNPSPDAAILRWAGGRLVGFDASAPGAVTPLAGAGSDRCVWRFRGRDGSAVVVSNPPRGGEGLRENDSFVYLAGHLRAKGLPAPEVFDYEPYLGACIMEDLGDVDLYSCRKNASGAEAVLARYGDAVALLARMQTAALDGFEPSRCMAPGPYDRTLMLESESGYFRSELLGGLLCLDADSPDLVDDCERLADEASAAGTAYFLHRDYQSMNLKIHDDRTWLIDFQGARLGPPQYDLAALLYDPYVALPPGIRRKLLALYFEYCGDDHGRKPAPFMEVFPAVAAHRLMQALGAYGRLGHRRGKKMFLSFISPALDLLDEVLHDLGRKRYPALAGAAATAKRRSRERT